MNPTCKVVTRDEFNRLVLKRDGNACVICGQKGDLSNLAVHHIFDRKLWDNGGYFVENGVTLCKGDTPETSCHIKAEMTLISVKELWEKIGVKHPIYPDQLTHSEGEVYDKWGNQILPSGVRIKGELFCDTDCQRMLQLADLLPSFSKYIKYPRTMHLPWSENLQNDDRRIQSLDAFKGQEVIISEKMDGENSTGYPDYLHARSLDSKDHPSRSLLRQYHASFKKDIPEGWRICMENVYARHSVAYDNLSAFVFVFNIWDETNTCLSWDDMVAYCSMMGVGIAPGFENGLPVVPVLWRGIWDEGVARDLANKMDKTNSEGYVVRLAGPIKYSEWRMKAAKFVRKGHVTTDAHWMRNWQPNALK